MVYFLGGLLLFIHVRASRPRVPSQQYHLVHNLPFVLYNIWESYFFVAKQPHFFGASKGNHKFSQNAVLVLVKLCKKNASMERQRTGIFVHKPTFCC